MGKVKIGGIIQSTQLALVAILALPDEPGLPGRVLGAVGREGINLEFVVEAADMEGKRNIVFCIQRKDLNETLKALGHLASSTGHQVVHQSPVAILSVFGPHFREKPRIAETMFSALGEAGVKILAISTSISTLSCVVDESLLPRAVQAISEAFELP